MGFVSVVRSELLVSSWPSHRGTRMRPPCVPGGSRYRQLICQPFLSRRVMKMWKTRKRPLRTRPTFSTGNCRPMAEPPPSLLFLSIVMGLAEALLFSFISPLPRLRGAEEGLACNASAWTKCHPTNQTLESRDSLTPRLRERGLWSPPPLSSFFT